MSASKGRDLRFLANVDPIDVADALHVRWGGGGDMGYGGVRGMLINVLQTSCMPDHHNQASARTVNAHSPHIKKTLAKTPTQGLDPETTLVVIISKTFTTAETMLNARTCRAWLTAQLGELGGRLQRAVCGRLHRCM